MIRKGICVVCVLLLFSGLTVSASAAEGSIRVRTQAEQVTVHHVGLAEGSGYRLLDAYGGGYLTFDDTLSLELAAWLSGRTVDGISRETREGSADYSDLEEGLYLVTSAGNEAFAPFLVTIPWDGYHWEVEVTPETAPIPQTADPVLNPIATMLFSGAGLILLIRRRKNC